MPEDNLLGADSMEEDAADDEVLLGADWESHQDYLNPTDTEVPAVVVDPITVEPVVEVTEPITVEVTEPTTVEPVVEVVEPVEDTTTTTHPIEAAVQQYWTTKKVEA